MIQYWVAQFAGALAGAAILWAIVGSNASLGQNGWGPGYLGEYSLVGGAVFEIVFTAIFVIVILGSTGEKSRAGLCRPRHRPDAGRHPPRRHPGHRRVGQSGPQLRPGDPGRRHALAQLWLFIVAPLVGGALGGLLYRFKILKV